MVRTARALWKSSSGLLDCLRIAKESLENKISMFLKASKSKPVSQKDYKIWSGVSYSVDTSQW